MGAGVTGAHVAYYFSFSAELEVEFDFFCE
jgi:hypothetical protein